MIACDTTGRLALRKSREVACLRQAVCVSRVPVVTGPRNADFPEPRDPT